MYIYTQKNNAEKKIHNIAISVDLPAQFYGLRMPNLEEIVTFMSKVETYRLTNATYLSYEEHRGSQHMQRKQTDRNFHA